MRKRIIPVAEQESVVPVDDWLDLESLAEAEITSEDAAHPVEAALLPGRGEGGWRAATPGEQAIRLVFAVSRPIRRVWLEFVERDMTRTQEICLRWSADGGRTFRESVRQQWNFSPDGSTAETEDFVVNLAQVNVLELQIVPDISGGEARASLASWRVA
jgi:hypothetical protein